MPRIITDEQELLDYINNRPSKKQKRLVAIIVIVAVAAFSIFIAVQIHKASAFNKRVEMAEMALEAGNYEEAIKDYSAVIDENGNNASYFEGRGDAYYKTKQYQEAVEDYHAAIALDKSNEELYKKGVKAGLKTGDNSKAMAFINDMKTNISEEKGEALRKEIFVYPAEKALNKKLKNLQATANSNRDAWTNTLQTYTFFDIDHDGVKELLAEFGNRMSREKNLKIYAYRKGRVDTMLDRSEFGVVSIKCYDKTKSMEILIRGNGTEEYRYYNIKGSGYKKAASGKRRSAAAGAYTDGQWSYYSAGDYDSISQSEYEKITGAMKKGKARSTFKNDWK